MADTSIEFAGDGRAPQSLSGARSPMAERARLRQDLADGRLPAPLPDDRALARMLGLSLLVGAAMTAGAAWGVLHLLT